MLGNAVVKHFLTARKYNVSTTYRNKALAFDGSSIEFDVVKDSLNQIPGNFDYVINCIGMIKPFMAQNPMEAIKVNSLFPWQVAKWCKEYGQRLIHITTDCVYSGAKGKYKEVDLHDALDVYGKSKSLGECTSDAMVLRTSIIGEEIHKNASLISWAKSQKGKEVDGYATHLWNGITANWYAKVCDFIIQNHIYEKGLFHIFAEDDVSKFKMLHYFNEKFNLNLVIKRTEPEPIDRTLRTDKFLCKKLKIPTVKEMIWEMPQ